MWGSVTVKCVTSEFEYIIYYWVKSNICMYAPRAFMFLLCVYPCLLFNYFQGKTIILREVEFTLSIFEKSLLTHFDGHYMI